MRAAAVALFLALALSTVAGCGSTTVPTPTSLAWSAKLCDDIVFAASFLENKLPAHVYCLNADGSGLRPLTGIRHPLDATDHWEIRPQWSPDGSRIAMVSPAQQGILIVQPDGIVVRVAASLDYEAEQWPVWSPDGSRLAYVDPEQGISVVDANGLHPHQVAPPTARFPRWSPDSSTIAYVKTVASAPAATSTMPADTPAQSSVMIVDADGGEPRSLMRREATVGTLGAGSPGFEMPVWSPDGSMVAVHWNDVIFREERIDFVNALIAATVNDWHEFVYEERNASGPGIWSRDGRQLYYPGTGPRDVHPGIYVINADGTGKRKLIDAQDPYGLTLSPDGSRIAYADDAGVFVLHLDGAISRRIASWDDDGTLAGWSPAGDRLLFWVVTGSGYVVSDFFMDAIVELRIVNTDGTGQKTIAEDMFLDSMSSVIPAHAEWRPEPGE